MTEPAQSPEKPEEASWADFRATGLVYYCNTILHIFGWALVLARDNDTNEILRVYPARVPYRSFSDASVESGISRLTAAFGLPRPPPD